jgi:plasmid stability protein
MAGKQTKGSNPVTAVEPEAKSIRLELPPDIHQLFRVEAAKEGSSMAAVARRLVEEYLKRKGVTK